MEKMKLPELYAELISPNKNNKIFKYNWHLINLKGLVGDNLYIIQYIFLYEYL